MAWEAGKDVIETGQNKIKIYSKEVEDNTTTVTFAETDLIGELNNISGMGAKRESKELTGYHYDETLKTLGNSTANDIQFEENLVIEALNNRREQYNNKTLIANGIFKDNKLLYGCVGQITEWGMELPLGETCKLSYTMTAKENNSMTVATV